MRNSSIVIRSCAVTTLLLAALFTTPAHLGADSDPARKLGPLVRGRAALAVGSSRVIVEATDAESAVQLRSIVEQAGGRASRHLRIINGQVAEVPNAALNGLVNNPLVARVSLDRAVGGTMERTGATVGATGVRQDLGYDGTGIGVAIIDSGVTSYHDDLGGGDNPQRVDRFVDFVNGRDGAYDDYGHGTHVAGIVAGNGFDSGGARSGIAPGAHLIVLKALDGSGGGRISDVIAALDYVVANKDALNIRVVNLSIGAGVYESYNSDPLTLAAKRAVSEGIVVVASAGNAGHDEAGTTAYGGITAPGNAPWVLTVAASSHMGTVDPADDTIAAFSSRGPTAIDATAKPDVVAPGVGIESLSAPDSALYTDMAPYLLSGTVDTSFVPYLSLTGTSMSAPVVTGTVALMLQANPALTPNEVKAILEYTSRAYDAYDPLTEGAGFLNARGAVELAAYFANPDVASYPASSEWAGRIVWGNNLLPGGRLLHDANAWSTDVTWGDLATADGTSIIWGDMCSTLECLTGEDASSTWGTGVGSTAFSTNVVWGSACGGSDCAGPWTTTVDVTLSYPGPEATTVVWGSSEGDTVVWGSGGEGDTVVWGSLCSVVSCDPIVWNKL